LPGIAARPVLEVMTAASVVFSLLALYGLDWITRTGRMTRRQSSSDQQVNNELPRLDATTLNRLGARR
jgi:hypothetical protein